MPRIRFTYANVVATLALVLAISGSAIAATHYLITSTRQISPRVLKKLKGAPAYAVYNDAGYQLTDPTDANSHRVATLTVPAAGDYVASAKVVASVSGGSNIARSICNLTAHTSTGGTDNTDQATGWVSTSDNSPAQTIPLEVAHHFTGHGTIALDCEQNGLTSGGAFLGWTNAKIIATQVSSLSNTAVSG